ncbi:MAG: SGNH/GDSL hydrolase family protein [Chloroflexi bacterium]|nr:SGNH/GDSL hydrolase family protein [Chloroflexota bacterium]
MALAASVVASAEDPAGHDRDEGHQLVGTWSASPQLAGTFPVPNGTGFSDQTIRNIAHTSVGGNGLRVRLSNTFGSSPLTFGAISVGVQASGATLRSGSSRNVTFGGQKSVTVAPGAEALSDTVRMDVDANENLAVSLFVPGSTGIPTLHLTAEQTNYISTPGDFTDAETAAPFTTTSTSWYFLDGLDVVSPGVQGTIVAFGDSITDGLFGTIDANHRWPNFLSQRINDNHDIGRLSVVDEGISGNRILNDSICFGVNAQQRLDRDVLSQDGVRFVILLEGINDIGFSATPTVGPFGACAVPNTDVSAQQIIAGYQQIIAQTHAKGIPIFGGTLTPFKGAGYYTTAGEAKRAAVNNFIRSSGQFDGVIDFDAATRDPADPLMLRPDFDSGDHLHPNDAGYQAMANAVDLRLFRR